MNIFGILQTNIYPASANREPVFNYFLYILRDGMWVLRNVIVATNIEKTPPMFRRAGFHGVFYPLNRSYHQVAGTKEFALIDDDLSTPLV